MLAYYLIREAYKKGEIMFILDLSEYLINGLMLLGVIHYIMYLVHKYWKRSKV